MRTNGHRTNRVITLNIDKTIYIFEPTQNIYNKRSTEQSALSLETTILASRPGVCTHRGRHMNTFDTKI